ncbi:NB-ARC domain-containing disease resistance protein [Melia azedarach]|uniref:NB-ARC domain-containing disease resistance protein n=1 Tax=Melia azedarach TaxID=155640 RepID=A0ACC1Y2Q6_MELAZ|nr:NB-ARC domain-containing disease resistance protein [Melia azedarach]
MAAAIVSTILARLRSIVDQHIQQELNLLLGIKNEVETLVSNLQAIQTVLDDAEQRQATEPELKRWLAEIKDLCYDIEDVLDEWKQKLRMEGDGSALDTNKKLRFSLPFRAQDSLALNLKDLNECREHEKNTLIGKLLSEGSEERRGPHIISIVGIPGIGKTTLAQFAYNDEEVMTHFDNRVWVRVSHHCDELKIAKFILESLKGIATYFHELEYSLQYISQSIVGKKFLLVLDDVRIEDYNKLNVLFRSLKNGLHGSKILITTGKVSVASMMESVDVILLRELSEEQSWSLFSHIALFDKSFKKCEENAKKIVSKCDGLPLAIKIVASVLRSKRTIAQWESILDDMMHRPVELESGLFSSLWLSYKNLPSLVKQCFSYCAIFPKDCYLDKNSLIQLWMSQGYLEIEDDMEMEKVGEAYFNILATQSLFQEIEKDDDGNIVRGKMHHLVHDFVRSLAENECLTIEVDGDLEPPAVGSSHKKLRHSMLMLNKRDSFPDFILGVKTLRTLLIEYRDANHSSISEVLSKLSDELISLRAFGLRGNLWYDNSIIHIPKEIGNMKNLRYLNFSSLKIELLPEQLCELYNLETLVLSHCIDLKELPEGIGELVNLRHIVNDKTLLSYMPKGIGSLTSLRTLSEFVMGGGNDDIKASTIEYLKDLNQLQGPLTIKILGSVTDVSKVKEAEMMNKKGLIRLCLKFGSVVEAGRMNTDELVLEALQPPPNLEFLEIRGYKGNTLFPNWIMSLSRLRMLNFHNCPNIKHLPPFGKLPSLESLSICSMGSVKRVGKEFFGIESDGASSSSSVTPFPRLKSLRFIDMEEWRECEDWYFGIAIMPSLRSLLLVDRAELAWHPLPPQDHNYLICAFFRRLQLESMNRHMKKHILQKSKLFQGAHIYLISRDIQTPVLVVVWVCSLQGRV